MRNWILFPIILMLAAAMQWGCSQPNVYKPEANPQALLDSAMKLGDYAKPLLVEVGGEWCKWCVKFNKTVSQSPEIQKVLQEDFVHVHLFYDRKTNEQFVRNLIPGDEKISLPSFVLIDGDYGERIAHYTGKEMLDGETYDSQKVLAFLTRLKEKNLQYWDSVEEAAAREQAMGDSMVMHLYEKASAEGE